MKRIPEFEALRGLLALWVLVGHVIRHSGYESGDLGRLGFLAAPGLAVDVFIILSGFVIFHLLDHKHEGYVPFIVRRFFRLFPLLLVVLAISISLAGLYKYRLETFPWKTPFLSGLEGIATDTLEYLPTHIAVHLTMLHGLVPDWLLPSSQYALVGQAWSISVEWQFYLVAPLLFVLLRKSISALSGVLVAIIIIHNQYWLGEGFAINQAVYFLIGICCYFLFKNDYRLSADLIWLGVAVTAGVLAFLVKQPIALLLWSIFMGAALQAKQGETNIISSACCVRAVQFLGQVSYSVYLWHFVVIALVSSALLYFIPGLTQFLHVALLMPLTVLLTISISAASFAFIEKPGMDMGRSVVEAFKRRKISGPSSIPEKVSSPRRIERRD